MSFKIVSVSEKKLIGLKVSTTMEKASHDCPSLWMAFGSCSHTELTPLDVLSSSGESFGICIMTSENTFDYWATAEITKDIMKEKIPSDMAITKIPEGLYVCGEVKNLAELGNVYNALYTEWPQSQNEYIMDIHGACFELYPANWTPDTVFCVYAPVKKV